MELKNEYQIIPLFNSSIDSVIHISARHNRNKEYNLCSFFFKETERGIKIQERKISRPIAPWAMVNCKYWLCALYELYLDAK